jgi:hypothetical protein
MPIKPSTYIKMDLYSGINSVQKQVFISMLINSQKQHKSAPSALNSPMIGRIHNVRPGCGSCGK